MTEEEGAPPLSVAERRRASGLPQIDPNGRDWRQLKPWAERRIETSRATIDARGIDERDADFERGRIAALRELLDLGTTGEG